MSSEASGHAATALAEISNTGRADNYVPIFNNQQKDYREFKKRAQIYKTKMSLAGRKKETVFNLITMMSGKAWDLVEDMPTNEIEDEEGFDKLFEKLDAGFKY